MIVMAKKDSGEGWLAVRFAEVALPVLAN